MTKYLLQNLKQARRKKIEQKNWSLSKPERIVKHPVVLVIELRSEFYLD